MLKKWKTTLAAIASITFAVVGSTWIVYGLPFSYSESNYLTSYVVKENANLDTVSVVGELAAIGATRISPLDNNGTEYEVVRSSGEPLTVRVSGMSMSKWLGPQTPLFEIERVENQFLVRVHDPDNTPVTQLKKELQTLVKQVTTDLKNS
ncbi:hypothetical protein AWH63_10945 [Marinobacter sp. C18]|uniref:hypothetical protein n=1 Tax=Marinobacter sp. C18 TaxID=1772288 RepID=UPI000948EF45|nr:hypothetical protein [Marinobacter sp. C18]OLF82048.1 hypothetical protein AWH63_10945 [Marinobacter sp. C18]